MSVERVTITGAEEQYAPPQQEIDIAVVDGLLFIDVYDGSLADLAEGRTKKFTVPTLKLADVLHAISAFNEESVPGVIDVARRS
jgi:hypothetical protein